MTTNPFKSFIPFTVALTMAPTYEIGDIHLSHDPSAGSWRSMGIVPGIDGDLWHDLDGAGHLLMVQFNERILPGKVRDEQVKKAVVKLEAQIGHKVSKKDYAQLREQVEFDLLPKAFIRRTQVPVLFLDCPEKYLLVCTSSHKRADDVISFLLGVFGTGLQPIYVSTVANATTSLTNLTMGGEDVGTDGDRLEATDSAVLKGEQKRTVRIKDRDIGSHEVQQIVKQDYRATELGIGWHAAENYGVSDNYAATFVLTDALAFKRVVLIGTKAIGKGEDHAFAWLTAKTYRKLLGCVVAYMDGLVPREDTEDDGEI